MKQAVTCPIILPEVYGFSISNQPPSAHITNVLGFQDAIPNDGFSFCYARGEEVFSSQSVNLNALVVSVNGPSSLHAETFIANEALL